MEKELLRNMRRYAVMAAYAVVFLAVIASNADSYMDLRSWALAHDMTGIRSWVFPLYVDTFPFMGEVFLFVAMVDRWDWKIKLFPGAVIIAGLALSVGLNVGQVHTTDDWTQFTFSLPSSASGVALFLGSLMFDLIQANKPKPVDPFAPAVEIFADDLRAGKVPGLNKIRQACSVGEDKARAIQEHFKTIMPTLLTP